MVVSSSRVADLADGSADVGISGAAAEVAAHPLADLRVAGGVSFFKQSNRRHDLTGRAIAALEGIMGKEGALHRMQLRALGQSLDGRHLMAFAGDRKRQACQNTSPVNPERACAAGPLVATLLGAGKIQVFAQGVEQARARIEQEGRHLTIDMERDLHRLRTQHAQSTGAFFHRHHSLLSSSSLPLERRGFMHQETPGGFFPALLATPAPCSAKQLASSHGMRNELYLRLKCLHRAVQCTRFVLTRGQKELCESSSSLQGPANAPRPHWS